MLLKALSTTGLGGMKIEQPGQRCELLDCTLANLTLQEPVQTHWVRNLGRGAVDLLSGAPFFLFQSCVSMCKLKLRRADTQLLARDQQAAQSYHRIGEALTNAENSLRLFFPASFKM